MNGDNRDNQDASKESSGNSLHFTYSHPKGDSLQQGDVLKKTAPIKKMLSAVHPHYLKDDYTHLIVISQSCDLKRRGKNNSCNARYITLAAVRPLETVLERELEQYQKKQLYKIAGVCAEDHRDRVISFVESLLNNNVKEYFYLNEDMNFKFGQHSCAFLQLPISVKVDYHYDKCLNARIMSLSDNFRARLGHHVGIIYSRVATADWVPDKIKDYGKFRLFASSIVEEVCHWYPKDKIERASQLIEDDNSIMDMSRDDLRKYIENVDVANVYELIAKHCIDNIRSLDIAISNERAESLKSMIVNDPQLQATLKRYKSGKLKHIVPK